MPELVGAAPEPVAVPEPEPELESEPEPVSPEPVLVARFIRMIHDTWIRGQTLRPRTSASYRNRSGQLVGRLSVMVTGKKWLAKHSL